MVKCNIKAAKSAKPGGEINRYFTQPQVDFATLKVDKAVKKDGQTLSLWLTSGESSLESLQQWVTTLESLQHNHVSAAVTLQLHMEDRSRCNKLQLRGLPGVT